MTRDLLIRVVVAAFILLIVLTLVFLAESWNECPREILGYSCRGKDCNHEPAEIERAKRIRSENADF